MLSVHLFYRPIHCPIDNCHFTAVLTIELTSHIRTKHPTVPYTNGPAFEVNIPISLADTDNRERVWYHIVHYDGAVFLVFISQALAGLIPTIFGGVQMLGNASSAFDYTYECVVGKKCNGDSTAVCNFIAYLHIS